MLSRIAESLFWIGRYVERAEDLSRLVDVYLQLFLEDAPVSEEVACQSLLSVVGLEPAAPLEGMGPLTAPLMLEFLAYDAKGPICGAITSARENARTVREVISSEMWESLNTTHNALPMQRSRARRLGPNGFFSFVKERAAVVSGLADSTMSRDEGWHFLVLGRSLERVDMTVRMLTLIGATEDSASMSTALLRCCGAHEAYVRTHRGTRELGRATEFLLLDRLFPRSVFAALTLAEHALGEVIPATGGRIGTVDAGQLALGRARTDLEFAGSSAVLAGLPSRLASLQEMCVEVSAAVSERFFRRPALVSWGASR